MNKVCILFAGPIGSGKSPIANYLSYKLNLPVFNNDLLRTEVREDLLRFDADEYVRRRTERLKEILDSGISFIYDASCDRRWATEKDVLIKHGYEARIISLDFSKGKLLEIWRAKDYTEFDALDRTFEDHQLFLRKFKNDVTVHLSDENFLTRLEDSFKAIKSK